MKTERVNGQLKKILGVGFGLAVVTGSTIGVGILRVPGAVAALLPDGSLIMLCWIVSGAYILLAANAYAELTTMMPKAGGAFNYIATAFGPFAGFLSGWFDYINNVMAPAYFCLALSEYVLLLFPRSAIPPAVIAIGFLVLFTALHLTGIRNGSVFQEITSAAKIFLFIILIAGCFWYGLHHRMAEATKAGGHLLKGGALIAMFKVFQLIMGTYDGWMSVSFFAEENANPRRSVPRSYFGGSGTVIGLYVLINAALFVVLPVSAISGSSLAVADAAGIVFGRSGSTFLTGFAIFSLISILNAYMMIPARILFGLSRDGMFVRKMAEVNASGTPGYALIFSFVISSLLVIFSSFEQLFALGACMMVLVTGASFVSLLKLRKSSQRQSGSYRAWGYPYSVYAALLTSAALFAGFGFSDPFSIGLLAALAVVAYVIYFFLVRQSSPE